MICVFLEKGGAQVDHRGGGGDMIGCWSATTYARREEAVAIVVHVKWVWETRVLEGAACALAGPGATIAEAGPGVAEALVARPDKSGLHLHQGRAGTEGRAGSREADPG